MDIIVVKADECGAFFLVRVLYLRPTKCCINEKLPSIMYVALSRPTNSTVGGPTAFKGTQNFVRSIIAKSTRNWD